MKKICIIILLTIHLFGNTIEIAKDLFDNQEKYKEAIEIFQKFKDNAESQYYLGKAYSYGIGVEKDSKKAFEYAKKSADKNNSSGLNLLGVMYQYGEGIEKDESKAFEYYKQSTDLGNTKAMRNLALVFGDVVVIKQDLNRVVEIYQEMINLKNIYGYLGLASINTYHTNNYDEALKYYLLFEENGGKESNSFQNMGLIYLKKNDFNKSIEYYKKAALMNNENAISNLTRKDFINYLSDEERLFWIKKAIELNIEDAYLKLYFYYVDNSDFKNLKLFLEKAYYEDKNLEMGCSLSSYYLNLLNNQPEKPNYEKAFKIANEIVEKNPNANNLYNCYQNLSYLYANGKFMAEDLKKSNRN